MKNIGWDFYQIFLAVARHGGLTGAAQASGLSPATIGRRILELEQQIGRSLFARSQTGYQLTGDGQALFDQIEEMEAAVRKVETWRLEGQGTVTIRIAVGTWNAKLLSENIGQIVSDRDPFRLDMAIGERRSRLTHREVDIGFRAFKPEEANLAARALPDVSYAAYRGKLNRPSENRFIAVEESEAISPYLRWPHDNQAQAIVFSVNRPTAMLDLAVAGAGCCVLPCFIGDREPRLERVGSPIKPLQHGQWIVMNSDDRHRREIRLVIDRIVRLMKAHAGYFAGRG